MKFMKKYLFIIALGLSFLAVSSCEGKQAVIDADKITDAIANEISVEPDSLLRHVVLFSFKEASSEEDIASVEKAFADLQNKIPQIHSYEWGLNNSPEGLDKGFTHCFFLTFKSDADRAIYLPHPDHKAFGALLGPHLEDVLVIDYWAK